MFCFPLILSISSPETAAYVSYLSRLLLHERLPHHLRVLDLCTGTGCIPLLFHHELHATRPELDTTPEFVGVDISATAINLANENRATYALSARPAVGTITFLDADVLATESSLPAAISPDLTTALDTHHSSGTYGRPNYDILISNPPYISPRAFRRTTARSVQHFEPALALVPPASQQDQATRIANTNPLEPETTDPGDTFYPHLLSHAATLNTQIALLEVADMSQALRVAAMAVRQGIWERVEIWRDEPARSSLGREVLGGREIVVRGEGDGRSVFLVRGRGCGWVGGL
ncbi:hypothetical protein LTR62_001006 [Meristemomyces frigidus]|uniref:Methyltransferase domain-containing protein n=1 Tax=Meristemomyces frigidus TaxID=1508187 RepID=A0AAN7YBT9_9PEZI|nr:hypothetical protein LTR62_001006 [Meristemomyces frigidus]